MTVRYKYNQVLSPPAPFVHVSLRCPETGNSVNDIPAQLDCAADRTVIPGRFVEDLQLVPLDEIFASGFGGQVFVVPTYRVELAIRNSRASIVEVIAHSQEPFVLLGRDVLNGFRLTLDGPALVLEIDD